jgi:hypothetical protein
MSLQSLPGPVSGSPLSLTIGFEDSLLNITVLRSWFLAGPFIDKAPAVTTRLPVADIADHERTSAPRRDLEQLSSDASAKLLRALGVN